MDGGYLNNIPVDVMRGMGVATVCYSPAYLLCWSHLTKASVYVLFCLQSSCACFAAV